MLFKQFGSINRVDVNLSPQRVLKTDISSVRPSVEWIMKSFNSWTNDSDEKRYESKLKDWQSMRG